MGLVTLLVLLLLCAVSHSAPDIRSVGAPTPFNPANALDLADFCNGQDELSDQVCVRTWMNAGIAQGKHLYASAGTYLFSTEFSLPGVANMHIRCESPMTTIFKRMSSSTRAHIFTHLPAADSPILRDFSWENCGFDINGWDMAGESIIFAGMLEMNNVHQITVRGNRFFDSAQPGSFCTLYHNCQRQYLVIVNTQDVLIEDNILTEGGRIKLGRPGSRMHVRNNRIHQVNDNAITFVQLNKMPTTDVLIEDNELSDALHSQIFFGSDGEKTADSEARLQDVTLRNNTMGGGYTDVACITGMLPNHTQRVYVAGNNCHKTDAVPPGFFTTGVLLKRAQTGFRFTQFLTVEHNSVSSDVPNVFNIGGSFGMSEQHDRLCLLNNTVRNNSIGIYLRAAMPRVLLLRNDLGPTGYVSVKTPATVHMTTTGRASACYRDRRHIFPIIR